MRRSLHQKLGTLLLSAPSFGAVVPHPSCLASCTIGRRPRHQQGWLAPPAPAAAAVDAGSKRDAPAAAVSPAAAAASAAFHTSSIRSCKHSSSRASTQVSCTGSTSGQPSAAADTQPQADAPQQQQQQPQHLQPQALGSFQVTAKDLAGSKGKVRLDTYLSAQLPDASRAKLSASIKAGLVRINRAVVCKPSHAVKAGDVIVAALLPPEPCTAIPESIPLDVVYEDQHLIVVNKAPGMVVHLSPGHTTGTLVNALLAHCGLPACDAIPCGSSGSTDGSSAGRGLLSAAAGQNGVAAADAAGVGGSSVGNGGVSVLGGMLQEDDLDEGEDDEEEELLPPSTATAAVSNSNSDVITAGVATGLTGSSSSSSSSGVGDGKGIIRPGIVHRLDRGTSGLMVVAKTDAVHAALCQQFKERSVSRIYNSITVGVPTPQAARVTTNIVRDPANRLRMMAVPYGSGRGRTAASNYQTLEVVAAGGAAVVQWKLETGRTHQIRVHAKHIGHPLLGDDVYGPNHAASSRQVIGKRSSLTAAAKAAVEGFGRPALHAKTLGFTHPVTRQRLEFDSEWPADFVQLYQTLRGWS